LLLAGLGVLAPWPALDRPRTSAPEAVSPLLDDRDLEDDPPSALARQTTGVLGLPPATIEGHAAVMSPHHWPFRYVMRPQLLTRLPPPPGGGVLRAAIERGGTGWPVLPPALWPFRYVMRPQLLPRLLPLPMGRDLHASIQ